MKKSVFGKIMEKWENLWMDMVIEWEDGLWGDEKEDCIEWFKRGGVDLIMLRRKLKDVYCGIEVDGEGCVNFKMDGGDGKYDDELKRMWNDFIENKRIEIEELVGDRWNKYYENMKV